VVSRFSEQLFTKLEQAGSTTDNRPGIHKLFVDIPYQSAETKSVGMALQGMAAASAQRHCINQLIPHGDQWFKWARQPERARIWFIKGGPGQGKSTVGQYLCQIQRAAIILDNKALSSVTFTVLPSISTIAEEIKVAATGAELWPNSPRIPVSLELKDYAQWLSGRSEAEAKGVLPFIAARIEVAVAQSVRVGTLRRAFSKSRWLFVFDGLDEVPVDVKDVVATEVIKFINDDLIACQADAFVVCTSRPQGYAGQFSALHAATIELVKLNAKQALSCAKPVLLIDRSEEEIHTSFEILESAVKSPAVAEIMTTPLQAHIMAVVVRDGGKPPERKWLLFSNFYQVIRKREANKKSPEGRLALLLREGDKLLKSLHNRLGFELHCRAETSEGSQTSITRSELEAIVREMVSELQETNVNETVDTLMKATTHRLVLVSTPDSGMAVRFDIRPLQEFFAAEFLYESVPADKLRERLEVIVADAHWRGYTFRPKRFDREQSPDRGDSCCRRIVPS
jgi:hypothetical protein